MSEVFGAEGVQGAEAVFEEAVAGAKELRGNSLEVTSLTRGRVLIGAMSRTCLTS